MRSSRSPPERGCSSPIRIRRGRDRQTRTRTGYCASTSRRAPTCPGGRPRTLKPSPSRSTTGPARSSAGRLPPKSSTSSYAHFNHPVLHRPVALAEYTSARFRRARDRLGVRQSMGRPGSALDNAVIESWHSTLEWELRSLRKFATRTEARAAVTAWIEDYNHERRHSALGMLSPVDYERALAGKDAA